MKILFWGTPDFALSAVRALDDEGFDIVGVVTQPDRPAGRGRRLTPSPVKEWAIGEGYPVLTPERPRSEEFLAEIRALDPDISIVVAYGHILKPEVLELPPGTVRSRIARGRGKLADLIGPIHADGNRDPAPDVQGIEYD